MTTTKKRVLLGVAGFLTLGIATGAAAVLDTMQTYSNACSPLSGFPGLLQQTGFLPLGPCKLVDGACSKVVCKTTLGKFGNCERIKVGKTAVACGCIPRRTSGSD